MTKAEILGLTWDCVDFDRGTLYVYRQLQNNNHEYYFATLKNGKTRKITLAPTIITALKNQKAWQIECRLKSYGIWSNNADFVFTNELGHHLTHSNVYKHFKRIAAEIGIPSARFHDLRHTYAVAALQSGDDIKTVQENLGHHTAAFTLDVYGHVTEQMKKDSAARMETFINSVKPE